MKVEVMVDIFSTTLKKDFKKGEQVEVPQKIAEAWEQKGFAKEVKPSKQNEK